MKNKKLNISGLFWGLALIIVGGLALASNFKLTTIDYSNLWRLWPIVIVITGASILAIRHIVWRLVSLVLVVLMLILMVWIMVGAPTNNEGLKTTEFSIPLNSNQIISADLSINGGVGEIDIDSIRQDSVITSRLDSNVSNIEYKVIIDGDSQDIALNMNSVDYKNIFNTNNKTNSWKLTLNEQLPYKLNINCGAGDFDFNLSNVQVREMTLNIGASNLLLTLGSYEDNMSVDLNSGASSIKLRVPNDSGIRLILESGLTSKELSDVILVGEDTYESSNYELSSNKININAKVGVSSFEIERY